MKRLSNASAIDSDLPLGWVNSPFSTPALIALLNWLSKALVDAGAILLFAKTYFLMDWRLSWGDQVSLIRDLGAFCGCHVADEPGLVRGGENKTKHTCYHCALSARGRDVSDRLGIKLKKFRRDVGVIQHRADVSRSGKFGPNIHLPKRLGNSVINSHSG